MRNFYSQVIGIFLILTGSATFACNLKSGQTVYGNNGSHLTGEVVNVYGENVEVLWKTQNGLPVNFSNTFFWDCSTLSAEVSCYGNLCNSNYVYANNGNHLTGPVKAIFENGMTAILWARFNGTPVQQTALYFWPANQLSRSVQLLGQIQKGDTVYAYNGNHLVGGVLDLFENGWTEVLWKNVNGQPFYTQNASYWPYHQLTKQNP